MRKTYFYILSLLTLFLAGCAKENPFDVEPQVETGEIRKSAINIDLRDEERVQTKAGEDYNIDDFRITFTKTGSTSIVASYRYGDMPDVVTLEKGSYIATAEYGEDKEAEWNNPYYKGVSDSFTVVPGKITDTIGDIVCRLENVKVSILFAPVLTAQMSDDSYVAVSVCESGQEAQAKYLRFTKSDEQRGISGYFRHLEGVSLVATFHGVVEGLQTNETKAYATVQKGYHYKITFKLHTQSGESDGDLNGTLGVDASVTVSDVERNIVVEEDEILDDSERPREEDPTPPENPDNPTPPATEGPKVTPQAPINFDVVNEVDPSSHVAIDITSETGITEFIVEILSEDLNGLGVNSLDLVNPSASSLPTDGLEFMRGLGIIPEDKTSLGGEKTVTFDVSGFMEMLCALGSGKEHTFKMTVGDASGTLVKELKLRSK